MFRSSGIKKFKWLLYLNLNGSRMQPVVGIDPVSALQHDSVVIGTSGISILTRAALNCMGATTPVCQKILWQAR